MANKRVNRYHIKCYQVSLLQLCKMICNRGYGQFVVNVFNGGLLRVVDGCL